MTGILAVFNDCAPEGREHYETWYNREHLPERVGTPGFRFGRRYALATGGDRAFFTYYEVDCPAVLYSPTYLERLENPTPWTKRAMRSFRNMIRTVCDLRIAAGDLVGSHAVVLRADQCMSPAPTAGQLAADMARQAGVARVQIWTKAAQQTRADTAEARLRGPDRIAAGVLMVECLSRADADLVAASLGTPPPALGMSGPSALGIYALLCIQTKQACA